MNRFHTTAFLSRGVEKGSLTPASAQIAFLADRLNARGVNVLCPALRQPDLRKIRSLKDIAALTHPAPAAVLARGIACIGRSDAVILDLRGFERAPARAMIEAGMAYAERKPIFLLMPARKKLPESTFLEGIAHFTTTEVDSLIDNACALMAVV